MLDFVADCKGIVTLRVYEWINPLQPSGHYMYNQFNIHYTTFCPQSVFMCFVWIWEQTAITSLYSIDWLVFITETECVYCAVRSTFYVLPTQCIYVFCVDLRTNSDYFTVRHWLVGFYNRDGVCLLRSTDWTFSYSSRSCQSSSPSALDLSTPKSRSSTRIGKVSVSTPPATRIWHDVCYWAQRYGQNNSG